MKKKSNLIVVMSVLMLLFSCSEKPKLPLVDFTFENNLDGPVSITFTNKSHFSDKYIWDFGDGNFSQDENPVHFYELPGNFLISLRGINGEGSVWKKQTMTIKGTTYRVKNNCSGTINKVIGFYINNGEILDRIGFGNLSRTYESAYVYTTRTQIYLGYKVPDGRYFIVDRPYTIIKDQNNLLEINDYTPGFLTDDPRYSFYK